MCTVHLYPLAETPHLGSFTRVLLAKIDYLSLLPPGFYTVFYKIHIIVAGGEAWPGQVKAAPGDPSWGARTRTHLPHLLRDLLHHQVRGAEPGQVCGWHHLWEDPNRTLWNRCGEFCRFFTFPFLLFARVVFVLLSRLISLIFLKNQILSQPPPVLFENIANAG